MRRRSAALLLPLAVLVSGGSLRSTETGDVDGDGVLTLRDVMELMLPYGATPPPDEVLAEGSVDLFEAYPCAELDVPRTRSSWWPASVYLEVLRRSVPDGLPSYSPMHWPEDWLDAGPAAPLASDARFSVRVLAVEHDPAVDGDSVRLELELSVDAPVRAFSLVLESDGLVRVPWLEQEVSTGRWDVTEWARIAGGIMPLTPDTELLHTEGDLAVGVPVIGFLITSGRYVVAHGLEESASRPAPIVEPGEYRVITRGRLPRGTEPGEYPLELLATSQVLFEDGTVASPAIEEQGTIVVGDDVTTGWDEGMPPLRIDPANRRVLGEVRFRFADAEGNGVAPGEPVARGAPGELVTFRVQVRTETPLNYVHFKFLAPAGDLYCHEEISLLEDFDLAGEPLVMGASGNQLTCNPLLARFEAWYYLGCNQGRRETTNYPERPWEYLKPLGEWLDLMEFEVEITPTAAGDVPLMFHRPDPSDPEEHAPGQGDVEFAPYLSRQFCFDWRDDPALPSANWQYEVFYEDASIRVDGSADPPPRPDLGIRFELGEAEGSPGEVVEVPVLLSWEEPLAITRLVLEVDEAQAVVEAVDTSVVARRDGTEETRVVRVVTARGEVSDYYECFPDEDCPEGDEPCCFRGQQRPRFRESEERFAVIDWTGLDMGGRVGAEPFEIARLRVGIEVGATFRVATLSPAIVRLQEDGLESEFESGGWSFDSRAFFAPAEVTPGRVWLRGGDRPFRRGDANDDAARNLTDAVTTLTHLFRGGGALSCPDAADSDDNGRVELTDAIFFLRALFVAGAPLIPPPSARCGVDPTEDDLGCDSVCVE